MTLRDLKEIAQDRNLVLQKRMKKIRMDKYTDTKRQENTPWKESYDQPR